MGSKGHRKFGPYYGCRFVGRSPDSVDPDVVAWLLYAGVPHREVPAPSGVLYNRCRTPESDRSDRWIARAHGPGHHLQGQDKRHFEGADELEAVKALWEHLNPAFSATAYQAAVRAVTLGPPPEAGCV